MRSFQLGDLAGDRIEQQDGGGAGIRAADGLNGCHSAIWRPCHVARVGIVARNLGRFNKLLSCTAFRVEQLYIAVHQEHPNMLGRRSHRREHLGCFPVLEIDLVLDLRQGYAIRPANGQGAGIGTETGISDTTAPNGHRVAKGCNGSAL